MGKKTAFHAIVISCLLVIVGLLGFSIYLSRTYSDEVSRLGEVYGEAETNTVGQLQTWTGGEWKPVTPSGDNQILIVQNGVPTWKNIESTPVGSPLQVSGAV